MKATFENADKVFTTVNGIQKVVDSIYQTINGVYVKIYPNTIPLPEDLVLLLIDFEYIDNGDGTVTITAWKHTLNGVASTIMRVPDDARIIL